MNKILNIFMERVHEDVEIYVRGLRNKLENLISVAHKKGIRTVELENVLKLRRDTLYDWKKNGSIPFSKLKQFNEIFSDIIGTNVSKNILIGLRFSRNNFRIPELNADLCYLVGYMYGDGTLSSHKTTPRIEFYDSNKIFLNYIASLVQTLFNIKNYKLRKDKRAKCYCLRINHKLLLLFFNKVFEMPIGRKKGKLHMPQVIKRSKYINDFICGFFDAEGHFYHDPRYGYKITLSQSDKFILEEIKNILESLGVKSIKVTEYRKGSYELRIPRKEEFIKFTAIFTSRHPDKVRRITLAIDGKSTVENPRV
jgi:hypothetical protein